MQREVRRLWNEKGVYKADHNPGPLYTIDTPPPTASGTLHIGHVFSYTHTDIIARYKRMSGFSVVYPFGVDGNGLATERFVEKKLGIRGHHMVRSDFVKVCLRETEFVSSSFKSLWADMGLSVDWNLFYSTISPRVQAIAQESFSELFAKGFVYRKADPALYCPACRTSVAQAELDDREIASFSNDIVFESDGGEALVVSTTRPEMLPACAALFYHPGDSRYVGFAGTHAKVPLFGHRVPIIADEQVSMDKGTGLVMCCTFGDRADITWYKKHNLAYKRIINSEGCLAPDTGILAGLSIAEARVRAVESLAASGLLRNRTALTHMVNVHERCKNEIEFVVLSQWFIRILDYKKEILELADRISWHPSYMKARFVDWVSNLGWDWCISRQKFYGVPFPVWHCKDCDYVIVAALSSLPVDPQETLYAGCCPRCKGTNIKPDTDVMDTWNTSSLTPYIVYDTYTKRGKEPLFQDDAASHFLPMALRPQAHDIIRTWAFYTIVKTWMHSREIPWKAIVISGHVLNEGNRKISKSAGGAAITPEALLQRYPADAIRYWAASGALGQDIAFSESQIQNGHRLVVKLWNAFRFLHENSIECDPQKVPESLGTINAWILHNASMCFEAYTHSLEGYEFGPALARLERFFWDDFCDNYLELVKDYIFNPGRYDTASLEATRWTLYTVGLRLLTMYAPYVPHVTEKLYQLLYKKHYEAVSIHQLKFSAIHEPYTCTRELEDAKFIMSIVSHVRKLKTESQLSLRTELALLSIVCDDTRHREIVSGNARVLEGVTQARAISCEPSGDAATAGNERIYQSDEGLCAVVICPLEAT